MPNRPSTEAVIALIEKNIVEVAVIQALLMKIEKSLFGNGQPGELQKIHARLDNHERRLSTHDKYMYLAVGSIGLMQWLTGAGQFSLKKFLGN